MHNVGLAWKNLKSRKKQTVRMILLFSVGLCLLIATNFVERGVAEFINYISKETPDVRILRNSELTQEGAEEIYEYYSQDERVLDVVMSKKLSLSGPLENDEELTGEDLEVSVGVYPYHKGIADYTGYTEALQEGEALIPQYFNPDLKQGSENMVGYKMWLMDTSDWLGKELVTKISYNKVECTLKIVGTYDNLQMCNYDNMIYVSPETISAMYNVSRTDAKWDKTQSITLIVKNQEDVDAIAKESGLPPLFSGRDENSLYTFFMAGLKGSAILLFVIALMNMLLTLTEEIRERRSEIGLLRALGYENGRIGMMLLWELMIVIGIVIVCVVIFSFVFVPIGNWCIDAFVGTIYQQVQIKMDVLNIVKVIGVSVVAMLATFAAVYYKMEQVNTIEVLKETPQV